MNNSNPVSARTQLQIPFHDVDMMRVAWHGHYLKYFEIARGELLDKIQYNYREMVESGYMWPVIDMRVKFIQPVTFGMTINIDATLVEYENRMKIEYLISDQDSGKRLTKGYTIQVAVDAESGEMCLVSPTAFVSKVTQA